MQKMKLFFLALMLSALPAWAQTQQAQGVFQDNSTNESEFRVERSFNKGAFATALTLPADTTTFTDTVPNPSPGGHEYCWRVWANNSAGDSANPTNTACLTTPPVINIPDGDPSNLVIQFVIVPSGARATKAPAKTKAK